MNILTPEEVQVFSIEQYEKMLVFENVVHNHVMVSKTNKDGIIYFVNDKFCEISGYSKDELIGSSHSLLESGYHSRDFYKNMWEQINSGKTFRSQVKNKNKSGNIYWVDLVISPVKNPCGEIVEFISLQIDITQQKIFEDHFLTFQGLESVISELRKKYIVYRQDYHSFFNFLLTKFISLIKSEYGFLGEIVGENDGRFLKTYSVIDISWSDDSRKYFSKYMSQGMEFRKLDSLYGEVIRTGKVFISNHPETDKKSSGVPQGHPPLKAFMGIPLYHSGKFIAMLGVANRPCGYSHLLYDEFKPLIDAIGEMVGVFQLEQKYRIQEQALRNKSLKITSFYNISPDLICLSGVDGYFKELNPSWVKTLGYSKEELLSVPFINFVHPDDVKITIEKMFQVRDGIEAVDFENRYITKLGEVKVLSWVAKYDEKTNIIYAIARDVTEQKIRERETQYILDSMKVGVWNWDVVNDILVWDESNYKVFDVDKKKFTGAYQAWEKTLHPDYKEATVKALNDALEGKSDFRTLFAIMTRDGGIKYIGGKGEVIRDNKGKPIRMVGINWDKTEEHLLMMELEEQRNLSYHQSKLASLGQLASGVGHEINNPLAIVKGFLFMIEKRVEEFMEKNHSSEVLDKIKKMNLALDRIAKIVVGLRTFGRLDKTDITKFDPIEALEESIDMVYEIFKNDGVDLDYKRSVQTDSVLLRGNRGRLQQVFMNLLSNAKDALRDSESKKIKVGSEEKCGRLVLTFEDNGKGIPLEVQGKVFDPFFTTKEVNKGTGIGLSLVHSFIKEVDGSIHFKTDEGKGTTFIIELPIESNLKKSQDWTEKGESSTSGDLNFDLSNAHVLLIEKDQGDCALLKQLLEKMHLRVTLVMSQNFDSESLERGLNDIQLVISGAKVFDQDGMELLKYIRSQKESISRLPFIFVTEEKTDLSNEIPYEKMTLLVDGYIQKPFVLKEVFDVLSNALKRVSTKEIHKKRSSLDKVA